MEKIGVLLSTYNGSKYISEQIHSLLTQKDVYVKIIIRDDGSVDKTIEILTNVANDRVECFSKPNVGVQNSFLELLQIGAEYKDINFFAFCDQDDIWLPDKLNTAITQLKEQNAALYYSSYTTVDQNLKIIKENVQHHVPDRLGIALVNLSVTGCTMVFTRQLLEVANRYMPNKILMHDSWLYKIALALNYKVVYDPVSHIYYRQHSNNVIGAHKGIIKKWQDRYKRWITDTANDRYNEAEELYKGFSDIMPNKQLDILKPLLDYTNKPILQRIKIATSPAYRTGNTFFDFSFFISIIAKRF